MERYSQVSRETLETQIQIKLNLNGSGQGPINTGIGFFDHLLDALKKHACLDLSIEAKGDLHIDGHHTVEDVGIVLGQAFDKALNERKNIVRFGYAYCPLDEALSRAVVDISGRPFFAYDSDIQFGKIGDFDGELFEEFLRAFAMNAKITLHVSYISGKNQHHILESKIKAFARALRMAIDFDDRQIGVPSTKGVLA
jgi:imidazoleglycerol-phosphate dehydratase